MILLMGKVCSGGGGVCSGGMCSRGCLVPGRSALGGAWSQEGCLFLGGLVETPRGGHCCGRYAFYWNAFLFGKIFAEYCIKMKVIELRGGCIPIAPVWFHQCTLYPESIIVTNLTFNRCRDGVYQLQFWGQCPGWNAPGMLFKFI